MANANLHVVAMPRWSSIVGVARLIIALLVLVFVATAAGLWHSAAYAAFGLTLFTASATLVILGYYSVSLCRKPKLYNAWAVLGLEIFGVIFWLVSFALCAEWTAAFNHDVYWSLGKTTNYGFWNAPFRPEDIGLESRGLSKRATNPWRASVGLMGTAAGLGALEFVLFVVVLVFFSVNLHGHRIAGKPLVFGAAPASKSLPVIVTTHPEDSTSAKGKGAEDASVTDDKKADHAASDKVDAAAIV